MTLLLPGNPVCTETTDLNWHPRFVPLRHICVTHRNSKWQHKSVLSVPVSIRVPCLNLYHNKRAWVCHYASPSWGSLVVHGEAPATDTQGTRRERGIEREGEIAWEIKRERYADELEWPTLWLLRCSRINGKLLGEKNMIKCRWTQVYSRGDFWYGQTLIAYLHLSSHVW